MIDRKKRLILNLRRKVKVQCSFDVEPLEGGRERHTCRECKTSEVVQVIPEGTDPKFAAKLSAYRARGAVTGICKRCSKLRAEERYPLPN